MNPMQSKILLKRLKKESENVVIRMALDHQAKQPNLLCHTLSIEEIVDGIKSGKYVLNIHKPGLSNWLGYISSAFCLAESLSIWATWRTEYDRIETMRITCNQELEALKFNLQLGDCADEANAIIENFKKKVGIEFVLTIHAS